MYFKWFRKFNMFRKDQMAFKKMSNVPLFPPSVQNALNYTTQKGCHFVLSKSFLATVHSAVTWVQFLLINPLLKSQAGLHCQS